MYDLNQKTLQALDALALEYETFEETMKQMEHETAEGDMLYAVAYEAMDDLDKALKEQAHIFKTGCRPLVKVCTSLSGHFANVGQVWMVLSGNSAVVELSTTPCVSIWMVLT